MFGYIRPFRQELKLREDARYRAVYCGLCHTLKARYGARARLLVNYDFLLPLMVYRKEPYAARKKRCLRHPFRKQCYCAEDPAQGYAADCLMLFTDWKLRDTIADEGGFASLLARVIRLIYRKGFRRAAERLPYETGECSRWMDELRRLEREGSENLEKTASAFGSMLACLDGFAGDEALRRTAHSLFYHLGRWIYVADAAEDFARDRKRGSYNAIGAAFSVQKGLLPELGVIKDWLANEQNSLLSAYDLMPETAFSAITENILTLGLQSRGYALFHPKDKEGLHDE